MSKINLQNGIPGRTVSLTQQEPQIFQQEHHMNSPTTHQGLERVLTISAFLGRLLRSVAGSLAINPKQR
jgi:hypothetical protein